VTVASKPKKKRNHLAKRKFNWPPWANWGRSLRKSLSNPVKRGGLGKGRRQEKKIEKNVIHQRGAYFSGGGPIKRAQGLGLSKELTEKDDSWWENGGGGNGKHGCRRKNYAGAGKEGGIGEKKVQPQETPLEIWMGKNVAGRHERKIKKGGSGMSDNRKKGGPPEGKGFLVCVGRTSHGELARGGGPW